MQTEEIREKQENKNNIVLEIRGKQKSHELMQTGEIREKQENKNNNLKLL